MRACKILRHWCNGRTCSASASSNIAVMLAGTADTRKPAILYVCCTKNRNGGQAKPETGNRLDQSGLKTRTPHEISGQLGKYRNRRCTRLLDDFWLSVLTDLNNRGLQDILIACVDGLTGFPEAINAIFPQEVQLCVIHQIRNSLKYGASKNQRNSWLIKAGL